MIGSGIMASRLSPDDVGLQLLENAAATAGALVGLILMFGAVSGAHFNPVVTLVDRAFGTISTRDAGALRRSPRSSAAASAPIVANLMFELARRRAVDHDPLVRRAVALRGRRHRRPAARHPRLRPHRPRRRRCRSPSALWIGGAYWFTVVDQLRQPGRHRSPARCPTASPASNRRRRRCSSSCSSSAPCIAVRLDPVPLSRTEASGADHDDLTARPVLFLCVHNAGRSQMAAGWLDHLAGDRVDVCSGGSEPADRVNPAAVDAMAEVGIDITAERPKPWTDEIVRAADVVVTMGCGDACPFFPGKRYEDWELDDPAGQDVATVRPIRDEIRDRVAALISSLDGGSAPH